MNFDSIDPSLRELLIKIKVVSKIPPGMKLNVKSLTYHNPESRIERIQRSMTDECRRETLEFIQKLINDATIALTKYRTTKYFLDIISELADFCKGLNVLRDTYKDDPFVVADLEVSELQLKHLLEEKPLQKTPKEQDGSPI